VHALNEKKTKRKKEEEAMNVGDHSTAKNGDSLVGEHLFGPGPVPVPFASSLRDDDPPLF